MTNVQFACGDWVTHKGKRHTFAGFITAICYDGQIVVQAHWSPDGTYRGMKHIYEPSQLELVDRHSVDCATDGCLGRGLSTVDAGDGPIAVCRECASDLEIGISNDQLQSNKDLKAWGDRVHEAFTGISADGQVVICATLGCPREATTHAKLDGINVMLCELCDKSKKFYDSKVKGETPPNFHPAGGRLDDKEPDAIQKNGYQCHHCSSIMSLTDGHAKCALGGYLRDLYCEGCKKHNPVDCFSWAVSGNPIRAEV